MSEHATAEHVVELRAVSRAYGSPPTVALNAVDLSIRRGEMLAIVGPSGSGKSTLLNIIGSLDRASAGDTRIAGHDVNRMSDAELSALRAHAIGFVFQQFHLSDGVTALDNVATGLLYIGMPARERRRKAEVALRRVGLGDRLLHHPRQLSGGERQRVAIARAVVGEPSLLLADEPTGSLDTKSGAGVVEILAELNRSGTTVVVITHDQELAERMPRQVRLRDGEIVADERGVAA
ncbi:ABC transporter ATP-binding protein [Microterricola viridarii]|uniref:Putative ABC transport system ATP-binding protein n=1 Tax=Microterricola viridarii TaxID=412690 RepID=A0A1H1WDK8_9MICO|nr:ABC transporter ATP-binding protein [Microterricola viridarii]SDS95092.1 putative ABC transport system ATP-binding protein [Microterricola viridarii]